MTFTEQWFSVDSRNAVANLVAEVANIPGIIIEIGAWEGRSTIAIANAAHPRDVHTVDTWAGSPSDESGRLAKTRNIHAMWISNVAKATRGNVVEHRMDWRDYVPTIDEPVAFAFLDAEHTYVEVFDAVTALVPLLSSGGVLCGDDISSPEVAAAVTDAVGAYDVAAALWVWRKP